MKSRRDLPSTVLHLPQKGLRLTAGIVCFLFLQGSVSWIRAAEPEGNVLARPIEIPSALASIQDSWFPAASPSQTSDPQKQKLVICIEDIHTSVQVQREIAELIHFLQDRYGMNFVAYEGREGPVETGDVFWFSDPKLRQAVSDKFLESLHLSGAEYAHVNSRTPFRLWGVEDEKLYRRNLKLFQNALRVRQETLNILQELERELAKSFEAAGSDQAKKFFEIEKNYLEGRLDLLAYVKKLTGILDEAKTGYSFLVHIPKILQKQVVGVKSREFFEELDTLAEMAQNASLARQSEKRIYQALKHLSILKHITGLSATRDEMDRYWANENEFREDYFLKAIRSVEKRKRWKPQYRNFLDDLVESAIEFYDLARQRDDVIAANLVKALERERSAILVAGGFHTAGLARTLRKEQIPYLVVSLKFDGPDKQAQKAYYETVMGFQDARGKSLDLRARSIRQPTLEKLLEARARADEEALELIRSGAVSADPEPIRIDLAGLRGEGSVLMRRSPDRAIFTLGETPSSKGQAASLGQSASVLGECRLIPPDPGESLSMPDEKILDVMGNIVGQGTAPFAEDFPELVGGLKISFSNDPRAYPVVLNGKEVQVVLSLAPHLPLLVAGMIEVLYANYLGDLANQAAVKLYSVIQALKMAARANQETQAWLINRLRKAERYHVLAFLMKLWKQAAPGPAGPEVSSPRLGSRVRIPSLQPAEEADQNLIGNLGDATNQKVLVNLLEEIWPEGARDVEKLAKVPPTQFEEMLESIGVYMNLRGLAEQVERAIRDGKLNPEFIDSEILSSAGLNEDGKAQLMRYLLLYLAKKEKFETLQAIFRVLVKTPSRWHWKSVRDSFRRWGERIRETARSAKERLARELQALREAIDPDAREKAGLDRFYEKMDREKRERHEAWSREHEPLRLEAPFAVRSPIPEPAEPEKKEPVRPDIYQEFLLGLCEGLSQPADSGLRLSVAELADVCVALSRKGVASLRKRLSEAPSREVAEQLRIAGHSWEELTQAYRSKMSRGHSEAPRPAVRVAEFYGSIYQACKEHLGTVGEFPELHAMWKRAVRFLSEAQDPSAWQILDEERLEVTRLSKLTDEELEKEFSALHPFPRYALRDITWDLFHEGAWRSLIWAMMQFEAQERKGAGMGVGGQEFKQFEAYQAAVKTLWIFREWVWRHWDGKPKPPSHTLFGRKKDKPSQASSLGRPAANWRLALRQSLLVPPILSDSEEPSTLEEMARIDFRQFPEGKAFPGEAVRGDKTKMDKLYGEDGYFNQLFVALMSLKKGMDETHPGLFSGVILSFVQKPSGSVVLKEENGGILIRLDYELMARKLTELTAAGIVEVLLGHYLEYVPNPAAAKVYAMRYALAHFLVQSRSETQPEISKILADAGRKKLLDVVREARAQFPAADGRVDFGREMNDPVFLEILQEAYPEGGEDIARLEAMKPGDRLNLLTKVDWHCQLRAVAERVMNFGRQGRLSPDSLVREILVPLTQNPEEQENIKCYLLIWLAKMKRYSTLEACIGLANRTPAVIQQVSDSMMSIIYDLYAGLDLEPDSGVRLLPRELAEVLFRFHQQRLHVILQDPEDPESESMLFINDYVNALAEISGPRFPGSPQLRQEVAREFKKISDSAARGESPSAIILDKAGEFTDTLEVTEYFKVMLQKATEALEAALTPEQWKAWNGRVQFLTEASVPSSWKFEADGERDFALEISSWSAGRIQEEIEKRHPNRRYKLPDMSFMDFWGDAYPNMVIDPSARKLFSEQQLIPYREDYLLHREWVYRHWDDKVRSRSHTVFASSLGAARPATSERAPILGIQVNPAELGPEHFHEMDWFLRSITQLSIILLVNNWPAKDRLRASAGYRGLVRRFPGQIQIQVNKLLSRRDFTRLKDFVTNRSEKEKMNFALIAPIEVLEDAASTEGMICLAADRVQDQNIAEMGLADKDRVKVFSALVDTAWRALAAGSASAEFLTRTRPVGQSQIYVLTKPFFQEWLDSLFAEHQKSREYLAAA